MERAKGLMASKWRTCTLGLLLLLMPSAAHSFHVPRPAFVGNAWKPVSSPTLSRVPIVEPTHTQKERQSFPLFPMSSTNEYQREQDPAEEEKAFDHVSMNGNPLSDSGSTDSISKDTDNVSKDTEALNGDAWFEPIQKEIEAKYARVREEMRRELEELRGEDPEGVPDNADLLMETVWELEMEEEIQAERNKAARSLLEEYESDQLRDTESRDLAGTEDSEVARKLQEELKEEAEQQAALQARIDDFMRYEQESFVKAAQIEVAEPDPEGNLDEWALERLENMLSSTSEDDVEVIDNLKENIQELRSKIEKEKRRGSIRPESLKEWQMYRAIATRMLENEANDKEGTDEKPVEDESAIAGQLQSWKAYQEKERNIRSRSGLSRGPKMPFDWYEAGPRPRSSIDLDEPLQPMNDQRTRKEIRAAVNQQAIEVLERLLESSLGTPREASLRQNLDDLKSGLEDDLAVEDEDLIDPIDSFGPVDVSDIFVRGGSVAETAPPIFSKIEELDAVSTPSTSHLSTEEDPVVDRASPDTHFFSAGIEEDVSDASSTPLQRPNTPFFSDDGQGSVIEVAELDSSKLGTLEEQKLRRMYRRAGAVTAEEQEKIKSGWEQFQNLEKQKRDSSGLSDDSSSSLSEADLKYNITEVMKDGDIDAEKILSSIGPRPTRTRKRSTDDTVRNTGSVTPPTSAVSLTDEQPQEGGTTQMESEEILDPMFRSISAIGGGRTKDDPEAKAKEKSAFEKFMQKQEEVRETLDEIDATLVSKTLEEALDELGYEETEPSSEIVDDESYSKEVLASIGSRPARERKLSTEEYERVFSDNGGVTPDEDDEEEDDESATDLEEDALVPEWMRKAKDGGGSVDSRGRLDFKDEEEHERNMEQLREYEQRRASQRPRQMGIDISDVFERDIHSDNDYAYETPGGWERGRSFSGFESRKANLLDYKELDVAELNLLMDTKGSVLATGVSQYLPRINKPFKDFGAIFRMEGVLVDVTGFEYEAWTKTAKVYGFKPPVIEDVKLAAVTGPEIAARKIFFWTDDFKMCKEIARTHQEAMKDVFANWMKENDIVYIEPEAITTNEQQKNADDVRTTVAVNSKADTDRQMDAWARTAEKYGFAAPSLDEVVFASVVSSDDAVMNAFRWTSDRSIVADIVRTYQSYLSDGGEVSESDTLTEPTTTSMADDYGSTESVDVPVTSSEPSRSRDTLSENDLLEIQYKAWLQVADEHDLDPPTPDEALGAMVINDPYLVVRDGFAWTDDPLLVVELVREYESSVRQQVRNWTGDTNSDEHPSIPSAVESYQISMSSEERQKPKGPTQEEVTEMKAYAWMAAAETHGCDEPMIDEFQAALYADPEYAVKEVYRWTDDDDKARAVAETYQEELDKMSKEYIEKYQLDAVPTTPKITAPKVEKPKGPSSFEIFQTASDAWKQVAEKRGFTPPSTSQTHFSLAVGPEDALYSFQWTDDPEERQEILEEYLSAVRETSSKWESGYELGLHPKTADSPRDDAPPPYSVIPGASKWLQSLMDVEMPCGVISHLDREQVDVLLDQTGLARFFPVGNRVTASNGYKLESQQMLGASLRLERRPDHCVVFDSSPESAVAAHDVDMKSVCLVGVYPMYELLSADSTARYLDELTAMNVRRLFGERIYDQPMVESKEERPEFKRQTAIKTRFWEEGDRE